MSLEPLIHSSRSRHPSQVFELLRDVLLHKSNDELVAQVARLVATRIERSRIDWVSQVIDLLQPLWHTAMQAVLSARVMHLDTSGLMLLDDSMPGAPQLGSLWGYVGDEQTAFYLYTSMTRKPGEWVPEELLAQRQGYVVVDGSSHFEPPYPRQTFIECGCNLQARHYFIKAQESSHTRLIQPLAVFERLYTVEEQLRGCPPEVKHAMRQAESKPIYDLLVRWCMKCHPDEPPSSPLRRAFDYVLDNEAALRRFLDDGTIPIDNGIIERLRVAMGRKSYLPARSDVEGHRAAIVYTLLSCCYLSGVNPFEYLIDVLPRLSHGEPRANVAELLPARWKAAS